MMKYLIRQTTHPSWWNGGGKRWASQVVAAVCLPAVSLLLVSCDSGAPAVPPIEAPNPPLERFEKPVAEALVQARQRVLDEPQQASRWGEYGHTLQAHELFPEAVISYRQAARLATQDDRWPYLAGLALRATSPTDAISELAHAETLHPKHAAFYIEYGNTLLDAGDSKAAQQRYERALHIDPDSAFAHFGLGRVALLEGDLETAQAHLQDALEALDAFREAHTLMAQVQQRLGDKDAAQFHTWKASNFPDSTAPPDPILSRVAAAGRSSVWAVRRGLAAAKAEQFDRAAEEFRKALAVRGDNATDLAYLGAVLATSGQLEEAIEVYQRALALDPRSVLAHNNMGQALIQQGDFEAAGEHLATALSIDPLNRDALFNLGLIRGRQKKVQESRQHLEAALRIAPGDTEVLRLLASLLHGFGDSEGALELWRRLLDMDSKAFETLEQVVRIEVQRGEHAAAIARLRKGVVDAPNSSRLVLFLAWELATAPQVELRDGAEAVRLASRVRQAYPEQYQPADVLAAAYAESGDFERAVAEIESALRLAAASQAPVLPDLEARRSKYVAFQPYRQPNK